jgi:hypothetical protein
MDAVTLVTRLLDELVEFPEELVVTADDDPQGLRMTVSVSPDDIGKVIGRQGRTIQAVRTVVRSAASRTGLHVSLELVED